MPATGEHHREYRARPRRRSLPDRAPNRLAAPRRRAALATASRPSRNGKYASDAATDPASGRGAAPPAFSSATLTASTRLIWPAPIASVRVASVKITVFDFTCAHTRQAKRRASHSSSGRLALRDHAQAFRLAGPRASSLDDDVLFLHERGAENRPQFEAAPSEHRRRPPSRRASLALRARISARGRFHGRRDHGLDKRGRRSRPRRPHRSDG